MSLQALHLLVYKSRREERRDNSTCSPTSILNDECLHLDQNGITLKALENPVQSSCLLNIISHCGV